MVSCDWRLHWHGYRIDKTGVGLGTRYGRTPDSYFIISTFKFYGPYLGPGVRTIFRSLSIG